MTAGWSWSETSASRSVGRDRTGRNARRRVAQGLRRQGDTRQDMPRTRPTMLPADEALYALGGAHHVKRRVQTTSGVVVVVRRWKMIVAAEHCC